MIAAERALGRLCLRRMCPEVENWMQIVPEILRIVDVLFQMVPNGGSSPFFNAKTCQGVEEAQKLIK